MKSRHHTLFKSHPWQLHIQNYHSKYQLLVESLMAQANGYIGSRGGFLEPGDDFSCEGVYLNGVYSEEPIQYGEMAFGYAKNNQKMIQAPNGKRIELLVDDEPLTFLNQSDSLERTFDFQSGILNRNQTFLTSSGHQITLNSKQFVSLANQNLMCICYEVFADDFEGRIKLRTLLDANYSFPVSQTDPRVGHLNISSTLLETKRSLKEQTATFEHAVKGTSFSIKSHTVDIFSKKATQVNEVITEDLLGYEYVFDIKPQEQISLERFIGYAHVNEDNDDKSFDLEKDILKASQTGFKNCLSEHTDILKTFWSSSDIFIDGDDKLQQGIRFNMYHVFQSSGRNGISNIGAKGLTGHGYDGHYFWDTEIYVIPFLCHTEPTVARKLIEFRINTLDKAKQRAQTMSHTKGALYPWRTIGGDECSAYYPAGTAQYHINADIAYALKKYLDTTRDESILLAGGAEMLFETARLWLELGYFNKNKQNQFCIDGVTGPDEYTALVNNNFYTNVMAKQHLQFAFDIAHKLIQTKPQYWYDLSQKISLTSYEIETWSKAAKHMYLPYDEPLKIHKQDDTFLEKKPWDFDHTPKDKYPLLLNFHPLVIYRHQVLKQADVILAMYLLDDAFDVEQKQLNLAYYEKLTTHDSSLSSCIHALQYAETGDLDKAYDFFYDTALMDLQDHHNNSQFGVHIASMAGSWAAVVHGFAGMRARPNYLYFNPVKPKSWNGYQIKIVYQGALIQLTYAATYIEYQLLKGDGVTIKHQDEFIFLDKHDSKIILFTQTKSELIT